MPNFSYHVLRAEIFILYLLAFRFADVSNEPLDLESWKIMWLCILNISLLTNSIQNVILY